AISSLCFDLSVYDIFGLLGAGGTIVIPTAEESKDPSAWYNYLIRENITIWNSVPAFMQILVEYCTDKKTKLSKVLLSGDWIPLSLPDQIKNLNDGVQVISLGGATEASIWSIYYPIEKCDKMWSCIPYGKPLNNQSFYILDKNMKLAPVGVAGDIFIGGDGLAKCYMNRPELTEVSFVDNPFITGERIYKTGDQGRWFDDGNIEFLGRIDNQVKIRGFRIELGEIENSIVLHKDISSGVVIVKDTVNGDKQLIAYYVSDKELELSGLRSFLKRSLPDYMIPSLFIYMETLPLTPNGKVDRKALPKVDVSINSEVEYVSPRNEIEKKLVEIWQEVLGIKKLGIYDSFFDLGGHSLTMTKVIFRINQMLDIEISMKTFFENNNISELAIVIDDLKELDTKEINDVLELFDIMI
ncbi:MAG: AMP-binding protein, partial [Deltaproteobacteria bacterium]|nr:AMP-binding protein [Deltaproteobacteria bacterium]